MDCFSLYKKWESAECLTSCETESIVESVSTVLRASARILVAVKLIFRSVKQSRFRLVVPFN